MHTCARLPLPQWTVPDGELGQPTPVAFDQAATLSTRSAVQLLEVLAAAADGHEEGLLGVCTRLDRWRNARWLRALRVDRVATDVTKPAAAGCRCEPAAAASVVMKPVS